MKRFILIATALALIGGAVCWFGFNRRNVSTAVSAEPPPAAVAAAVPLNDELSSVKTTVAVAEPPPASAAANPAPALAPVVEEAKPADPQAAALARALDVVLSPQAELKQKQAALRQLRDAGQLDRAIADLKQRAIDRPASPEFPLALAEAYLTKTAAATDYNERGILALQADQGFDQALRLAPDNWEAQFMKATSLAHWPEALGKGDEVIERFTALINQQEALTPRPEFVASYLLLGNQYQKAGNPEYARAVWQAGATLFPDNGELRGKLAGK